MKEEKPLELQEEQITFLKHVEDWQEAIKVAAQPLLEQGIIEKKYIKAMIQNVLELRDYIVLVPKVAMPHVRPDRGALGTGFSVLRLEQPVRFGKTHQIFLIICLATHNNFEHLVLLQKISSLIDEEEKVNALLQTKNKHEFVNLAQSYITEEEEEL